MTIIKFMENFNSVGVLVDEITIKKADTKEILLKTNRFDCARDCKNNLVLGENSEVMAFRFYPYHRTLILMIGGKI